MKTGLSDLARPLEAVWQVLSHFAPSLSCWRYSLSLASLGALDSAGASSLTTKGTINFFYNPFSFTSHTNARLPRLNPSLALDRSSPSRTLHLLDSLVYAHAARLHATFTTMYKQVSCTRPARRRARLS